MSINVGRGEAHFIVILFVVNETSGNGRAKAVWRIVERRLRQRGAGYKKVCAGTAGDAARQVEEILQKEPIARLAAVGGDGTVHSLLEIALRHRLPLGFIPCGSGNDTALTLGLPKNPEAALDVVLDGKEKAVDLMATTRSDGKQDYTLISLAIGLDGAVAEDVNASRYKQWCNRLGLGRLAYIIGLLRVLFRYRTETIHLTIDGETRTFPNTWLVAVANMPSYGGGLKICPDARPDDGMLDVCVASRCSPLTLLTVFPTVLTGGHVKSRYVTMLKGKDIRVGANRPLPAYGDGEPSGRTPLQALVLSRSLLVVTPSG